VHKFNGKDGAFPYGVIVDGKGNIFGTTESRRYPQLRSRSPIIFPSGGGVVSLDKGLTTGVDRGAQRGSAGLCSAGTADAAVPA
jgi:hypothetical protein